METALESTYYSVFVPKFTNSNRYIIGARLCIAMLEKIQSVLKKEGFYLIPQETINRATMKETLSSGDNITASAYYFYDLYDFGNKDYYLAFKINVAGGSGSSSGALQQYIGLITKNSQSALLQADATTTNIDIASKDNAKIGWKGFDFNYTTSGSTVNSSFYLNKICNKYNKLFQFAEKQRDFLKNNNSFFGWVDTLSKSDFLCYNANSNDNHFCLCSNKDGKTFDFIKNPFYYEKYENLPENQTITFPVIPYPFNGYDSVSDYLIRPHDYNHLLNGNKIIHGFYNGNQLEISNRKYTALQNSICFDITKDEPENYYTYIFDSEESIVNNKLNDVNNYSLVNISTTDSISHTSSLIEGKKKVITLCQSKNTESNEIDCSVTVGGVAQVPVFELDSDIKTASMKTYVVDSSMSGDIISTSKSIGDNWNNQAISEVDLPFDSFEVISSYLSDSSTDLGEKTYSSTASEAGYYLVNVFTGGTMANSLKIGKTGSPRFIKDLTSKDQNDNNGRKVTTYLIYAFGGDVINVKFLGSVGSAQGAIRGYNIIKCK